VEEVLGGLCVSIGEMANGSRDWDKEGVGYSGKMPLRLDWSTLKEKSSPRDTYIVYASRIRCLTAS